MRVDPWPCGCRTWNEVIDGKRAFVLDPCGNPRCVVQDTVKQETRRRNQPILIQLRKATAA